MQKITINDTEYRISFAHYRTHETAEAVRDALVSIRTRTASEEFDATKALLSVSRCAMLAYLRTSPLKHYSGECKRRHTRYHPGKSAWTPGAHGGATRCYLWVRVESGDLVCVGGGTSECSKKDSFEYAVGRAIALQRAIANLLGWKSMGEWRFIHSKLWENLPVETLRSWWFKVQDPMNMVEAE